MIRTYKYRLRPTRKQVFLLDQLLAQMQAVYNDALNERRRAWQRSRRSVSYGQQWSRLRVERHRLPEEMGLLNATSMQQMLRRVDKAYRAFYKGQRSRPRFKGRGRFKSLEYRHGDGCKADGDRLYVQHVGRIKIRLHRPLPDGATVKHVALKRSLERWYACLMLDLPDAEPRTVSRPDVGIDVGLDHLLALSDGVIIDNPRWLRNSLAELRVAQRRLARRQRFGANWRKAARWVAVLHERVARQRREFWHQTTRRLVDSYGHIAIEDLSLTFMTRNGNLALAAHDAGLGMFRQLLAYKAEEAGTQVIAVNPARTSQVCSGCGSVEAKGLGVRVHHCSDCGLILDRDINAARNILALGRSAWALTWPVGASVAQEAPPL